MQYFNDNKNNNINSMQRITKTMTMITIAANNNTTIVFVLKLHKYWLILFYEWCKIGNYFNFSHLFTSMNNITTTINTNNNILMTVTITKRMESVFMKQYNNYIIIGFNVSNIINKLYLSIYYAHFFKSYFYLFVLYTTNETVIGVCLSTLMYVSYVYSLYYCISVVCV